MRVLTDVERWVQGGSITTARDQEAYRDDGSRLHYRSLSTSDALRGRRALTCPTIACYGSDTSSPVRIRNPIRGRVPEVLQALAQGFSRHFSDRTGSISRYERAIDIDPFLCAGVCFGRCTVPARQQGYPGRRQRSEGL